MSLEQLAFVRGNSLKLAKALDEDLAKVTPNGFNNNMLWNLGHIYVVHENLIVKAAGKEAVYPEGFVVNFNSGTRPAEWGDTVPTLETVINHLEEQGNRLKALFEGHLDDSIPKPIEIRDISLSTPRDLIGFATVHEAMHATTVKLFNQLLENKK